MLTNNSPRQAKVCFPLVPIHGFMFAILQSTKMPRATPIILEVSGLTIRRGRTRILRGIDWRVEHGQHWAILGANGSGKTSLLSAVTGYFMPTDGAISVLGRRFGESDWRELRKHVGLVSSSIR